MFISNLQIDACWFSFSLLGNGTKLLAIKKGLLGLINVKDRTFKTLSVIDSKSVALTFDLARSFVFWADGNGSIYKTEAQKSRVIYSGKLDQVCAASSLSCRNPMQPYQHKYCCSIY